MRSVKANIRKIVCVYVYVCVAPALHCIDVDDDGNVLPY